MRQVAEISAGEREVLSRSQGKGGRTRGVASWGTGAERRGNAQRTARVAASCGAGPALAGVLSSAFLERVAGGQPLLLRDRRGEGGQVVAVLLDPDSYAELQVLVDEALA